MSPSLRFHGEKAYDNSALVIVTLLADLVVALGSSLDPGPKGAQDGPDFPFTYLRGHPSFPTHDLPASGPYRIVVGRDRLLYTGERRRKPIFQLPSKLIRSIGGQDGEQLTIRLGDHAVWVDIDFRPTGLTKKRDMKRLISCVSERADKNQRQLAA